MASVLLFTVAFMQPTFVTAGELPPIHPGYPEVFDALGFIEFMEHDMLVVNDATLGLLPSTTFNAPNGMISLADLSPGKKVGLILTEDRRIESLWLIEEGTERKDRKKPEKNQNYNNPPGPEKNKPYWFDDGVWKN